MAASVLHASQVTSVGLRCLSSKDQISRPHGASKTNNELGEIEVCWTRTRPLTVRLYVYGAWSHMEECIADMTCTAFCSKGERDIWGEETRFNNCTTALLHEFICCSKWQASQGFTGWPIPVRLTPI